MSNSAALLKGFLSGVTAPALLFGAASQPSVRPPIIQPLYQPAKNANAAFKRDVAQIGKDYYSAIEKYGKS
jgi:hypothetical protein